MTHTAQDLPAATQHRPPISVGAMLIAIGALHQAFGLVPGLGLVSLAAPAHAEEMYAPEVFGRSASDRVLVEREQATR